MMTKGCLFGLVAETPVHAGIGKAAGALDLPVAREAVTGFPHVPGSGVKGALRVWAGECGFKETDADCLFGKASGDADDGTTGNAGAILCGEARLALLPVRCTSDVYKFVTCPLIVERLQRDLVRIASAPQQAVATFTIAPGHYLGQSNGDGNASPLGLEEREFAHGGELPENLADLFAPLVGETFDQKTLKKRIVVLCDEDFKWFARFGLPIATRNKLDANKIVERGALWSEETLAPDTVMWVLLGERVDGKLEAVCAKIGEDGSRYIQMGGNETIGQGWFSMRRYPPVAAAGGGSNGQEA